MKTRPSIICFWMAMSVALDTAAGFALMVTPRSSTCLLATNPKMPKTSPAIKPVALKHLFRHYDDISMDCWLRCSDPLTLLLSCGYTQEEVDALTRDCPALLKNDVHDHLAPHLRFLVRALGGGTGDLVWAEDGPDVVDETGERHQLRISEAAKKAASGTFFNLRLEKALAPWHAYLMWNKGLSSGSSLLEDQGSKLRLFLEVCRSSKLDEFVKMCNTWDTTGKEHTSDEISEFVSAFRQGLVPAVRNHLRANIDCEPGEMVEILLRHGANHLEDDNHGASLLHWAAGTGNMRAVQALIQAGKDAGIPVKEVIASDHSSKDGATPLHWAASGVTSQGVYGSGGHPEICRLLLDLAGKDLTDEVSYNHNSPLEWAAWAGSLEVVQLLVEDYGANVHFCSENGNVAHWACAGGSLQVCQYLGDKCGVDLNIPNSAKGWTPLDLASAEGHSDVAEWLVKRSYATDQQLEMHTSFFEKVFRRLQEDSYVGTPQHIV